MKTSEWIMVFAVLAAPILAVQAQKYLEMLRETRGRKLNIFMTLMATRAARVSAAHVQALNMIDLEFYGQKVFGFRFKNKAEKAITEAWKIYLDHLTTPFTDATLATWSNTGDEQFTDLLYKMADSLGYHFDRVHLKKGIYSPKAHGDDEFYQRTVRENLVKVLSGTQALKMDVSLPGLRPTVPTNDVIQVIPPESGKNDGQRSI